MARWRILHAKCRVNSHYILLLFLTTNKILGQRLKEIYYVASPLRATLTGGKEAGYSDKLEDLLRILITHYTNTVHEISSRPADHRVG